MDTITTYKLRQMYGLTGELLRRLRVKLQALGYLGRRVRKGSQTYELVDELPASVATIHKEYVALFRTTVRSAMGDVEAEVTCLADEMGEWRDNLSQYEGLNETDKYYEVESCADALEGASFEEVPEAVAELEFDDLPVYDVRLLEGRSRYLGRGRRLANEISTLRNVIDTIGLYFENDDSMPDDVREYMQHLEEQADELEGIEFPSMM